MVKNKKTITNQSGNFLCFRLTGTKEGALVTFRLTVKSNARPARTVETYSIYKTKP